MKRVLWLVFFSAIVWASPLRLEEGLSYSLHGYISYMPETSKPLEWQEALKSPFKEYQGENVNFGFVKSPYWFRFTLQDLTQRPHRRWWLLISYPLLEKIDFYAVDPQGKLLFHKQMGSLLPYVSRDLPLRDFTCELPFRDRQMVTYLVRIETQSSMQFPVKIYSSPELYKTVESANIRVGIYYGIFVIIFLYNAVIYFYTRDRNYLRYMFFLFSFIMWQLSFDGMGSQNLWRDSVWMVEHGSSFWVAMSAFSALYFSRNFLHTYEYTKTSDRIIRGLMGIAAMLAAASLVFEYGDVIAINAALASVIPIVLFITGIVVLRRNYRPARFYVAGWTSFLIGTIIFTLNKFNIIPSFEGVNHTQQIGSAIEMLLLSLALADRVRLLQREYIQKLSELNETLSAKVKSALAEARQKDRLFVQQSRLAALGEMIEQIAHQWRQPLNTLALINQDMYVRHKLGKCDGHCIEETHERFDEHLQYLSKTIDDFRNYYKADKSKQFEDLSQLVDDALRLSDVFLKYAKIKTSVSIQTKRQVYLAKNEMIQVLLNLIKNAHDAIVEREIREGRITIRAEDNGSTVRLMIEDNGGGISPDILDNIFEIYFTTKKADVGTGLGLHMSKYIVENSFGGAIWVEPIDQGVRFVIELPVHTV